MAHRISAPSPGSGLQFLVASAHSCDQSYVGSSLNQGPFLGPFYKDAVLYLGPKNSRTTHVSIRGNQGFGLWNLKIAISSQVQSSSLPE